MKMSQELRWVNSPSNDPDDDSKPTLGDLAHIVSAIYELEQRVEALEEA